MKILIRTNQDNVVEVVDATTKEKIVGISKIHIYVDILGKVCADLTIKNIELDLGIEEGNIKQERK